MRSLPPAALLSILLALTASPLMAQTQALPPLEVAASRTVARPAEPEPVSRGRLSPDPAALPAHVTVIGADTVERRPVRSYGDLLRPVTGMNVSNYGQGGVGYGLALRGYTDAEHGRDIAYVIDGMPVNEVSSIHTPNYADLNPLLPETIERIEIIRGPFSAEHGDGALGGVVNITTKTRDPYNLVGLSGGSHGTLRGVGTWSGPLSAGVQPFLALEGFSDDGYRTNAGSRRYNSFNKFTLPAGDGILSARVQAYGTDFGAPGYVSRDSVLAGRVRPPRATNGTDGGSKHQETLVVNFANGPPDQGFSFNGFATNDRFARFADFGSGQRGQIEHRNMLGVTTRKVWSGSLPGGLPVQLSTGGNLRADMIDTVQSPTVARAPVGRNTLDLGIAQQNVGVFAQLQAKPADWLKLTGGARYDHYFFDITDRLTPANGSGPNTGAVSPKAGLAVTPVRWLEVFGNYGEGLRAPSASAELLTARFLKPLDLESKEIGIQLEPSRHWRLLATAWTSDLTREVFQPAPGLTVQNLGRSRRQGYDIEARQWLARDDASTLSVFASYAAVRATLIGQGAFSQFVPNVPQSIVTLGLDGDRLVNDGDRLFGELIVQSFGRKNLTEDGRVKTAPYQRLSGRAGYGFQSGWSAFLDGTWYPGDRTSETAFNFGPGVGASTADIVTSPQPSFVAMAGLSYRFATGR